MFFRKRYKAGNLLSAIRPQLKVGAETRQGIVALLLLLGAAITALGFLGQAGALGAALADILAPVLGAGKWVLPALLGIAALSAAHGEGKDYNSTNVFGLFLFLVGFCAYVSFYSPAAAGSLGRSVGGALLPYLGPLATAALLSIVLLLSLLMACDTSLSRLVGRESLLYALMVFLARVLILPLRRQAVTDDDKKDDEDDAEKQPEAANVKEYEIDDEDGEKTRKKEDTDGARKAEDSEGNLGNDPWPRQNIHCQLPLDLLKSTPKRPAAGDVARHQEVIAATLKDFGIPVTMGEVRVGPTVTQYSFKPQSGVPVARVRALADDLALNLAVHPVRIEAPIPGQPYIGLEVPNRTKVIVSLKEVLRSPQFRARQSGLMIPLGRDVRGQIWLDDLAKLPHLLVGGATMSGKSVFLHALITGLLYQNDPDDLRLLLVDVKQVELTAYNGLPYLVTPVITDAKRAVRALQWCLTEMERRLALLNEAKCQNIRDYNRRHPRLPYLVVVVDELGDLLATARKDAEGAIIRLGQKARAAGIHLVLATQRPSVDVISGLIKANLPGRAAFCVSGAVNSRCILDCSGAEKLLGYGDMLYLTPALSKPVRIQGAFIGKEEIASVVRYVSQRAGQPRYIEGVTEAQIAIHREGEDEDAVDDALMAQAKQIIFDAGKASTAMLQSRLSIGYPRANRLLTILEDQGVVGPAIHNKPREVLK